LILRCRALLHHGPDGREDDDHNGVRHVTTGNIPVEKRPKGTEDDQLRRRRVAIPSQQAGNHMDERRVHHFVARFSRILFLQLLLLHEMANLRMV